MAGMRDGSPMEAVQESDLGRWRLIGEFSERIAAACAKVGLEGSFADARRKLGVEEYLGLFLFGLLNPVVRTMRGLCGSSHLERVQKDVCSRPVSLGSFSEAQQVLDVALLEEVFKDLAQEVGEGSPAGKGRGGFKAKPWMI